MSASDENDKKMNGREGKHGPHGGVEAKPTPLGELWTPWSDFDKDPDQFEQVPFTEI